MKYTLNKRVNPSDYWNGAKPLPDEINVMSYHSQMAEFELLSILCTLHGCPTAYDLLTGSVPDTAKDNDIRSIMTAFQSYLHPKMPPSNYTESDERLKLTVAKKEAIE